jgi:hypothetical protein
MDKKILVLAASQGITILLSKRSNQVAPTRSALDQTSLRLRDLHANLRGTTIISSSPFLYMTEIIQCAINAFGRFLPLDHVSLIMAPTSMICAITGTVRPVLCRKSFWKITISGDQKPAAYSK